MDYSKPKSYERRTKTPEQALSSLMRLASRSEKSSGDALRLMRGWGVDPAAMPQVLKTLTDQKFIDDRRYADAYVREKSGLNGWGVHKIRRMLSAKGIGRETIEQALGQVEQGKSAVRLHEMLARKMRTAKAADNYQLKGKLMRYGLSLGHDYDEVIQQVEKLIKDK